MKNKKLLLFVVIIFSVVLSITIYSTTPKSPQHAAIEGMLPPLVMIDGTLFRLDSTTIESQCASKDGTIKEVALNIVPSVNEQANFGYPGMEYWCVDDYIVIKINQNFLKFKKDSST